MSITSYNLNPTMSDIKTHRIQTLTHKWPEPGEPTQGGLSRWVEGKSDLKGKKRGPSGRDYLSLSLTQYKNHRTRITTDQRKFNILQRKQN